MVELTDYLDRKPAELSGEAKTESCIIYVL